MAVERIEHAAKAWVESNFPAVSGIEKARLVLAYGLGMDAGLAEAQQMIAAAIEKVSRGV